jgi:hypothetical protein
MCHKKKPMKAVDPGSEGQCVSGDDPAFALALRLSDMHQVNWIRAMMHGPTFRVCGLCGHPQGGNATLSAPSQKRFHEIQAASRDLEG